MVSSPPIGLTGHFAIIARHTVIGYGKSATPAYSDGFQVSGRQLHDPGLPAKKDVEWKPHKIKESEVRNVWYDSESGKMQVKYDTGRQVSFDNIKKQEARDLIKSRNPSKHIDKKIKPKHFQRHFPTIWV